MKPELSGCAARLPGPQGSEEPGRQPHSPPHILQLPRHFPCGGILAWFPAATERRAAGTGHPDPGAPLTRTGPPSTQPGHRSQLGPRPGKAAAGRPPGTGLTAPVTTRTRGAAARGTAPLRSSSGAPPAPEHPEDPEDRRSPGAEGLCSRISTPGPSFPAAGTGWARGRSPSRSPEGRRRGAGGAAVRPQPPALGAPLPPGRAAPRRTTGASDASPRLGCPRASRRRRAGRGWGRPGPRAADSALGLLEARA